LPFCYADNIELKVNNIVSSQVAAYGQQLDREMAGYVLEDTRLSTLQRKLSKVRASGESFKNHLPAAFLLPVNIVG
jgi:hypothetical protein